MNDTTVIYQSENLPGIGVVTLVRWGDELVLRVGGEMRWKSGTFESRDNIGVMVMFENLMQRVKALEAAKDAEDSYRREQAERE